MFRSKTSMIGMAGIAALLVAAIFAVAGFAEISLGVGLAGLAALGMVGVSGHRQLVMRSLQIRTSMQRDRRAIVGELRKADRASRSSPAMLTGIPQSAPAVGNTTGAVAALGGVGPAYEYAERALTAPGGLETFTLRVRSTAMRDVFARAATNLQYDAADVLRTLRVLRSGRLEDGNFLRLWRPRMLLALARIFANQRLEPADLEDAEVLFNAVRVTFGLQILGKTDAYIYAETLAALGRHHDAASVLRATRITSRDPVHAKLMMANALADHAHVREDEWLAIINEMFVADGLAPVCLGQDPGRSPLDRLVTDVEARSVDGPRVSIIVPSFNGSDFIRTTLDSLSKQTWKNLEIIVVDDASEEAHAERLRALCSEYEDVRLIVQPTNQGAYPARNRALREATGEFVTVHDDDDWSHAQKIEVQALHLLESGAAANMTRHARSADRLLFNRINNNPSFSQPNFSSLMVARPLLERLGGWDNVNRGADAEFRDRLVAATGSSVEVLKSVPMSFTRTHAASLTAGEIGRGYIDPSRLFYQASYQRSHAAALTDGPRWDELEYPRPINMLPGMRGKHIGHFDVVFATDFGFPGGTTHLTLNEISVAARAGLRVGLLNLVSPVNTGISAPQPRALEVAGQPGVEVLSISDEATVGLLVIRHASVVQFIERLKSTLDPSSIVVVINNPPVLSGGRGYLFDFDTVISNVRRTFGATPQLIPESGVTREDCLRLTRAHELGGGTWPGFVDLDRFYPKPTPRRSKPVLGRHSRDSALKWPSHLSVYGDVYLANEVYDVCTLGGITDLDPDIQQLLHDQTTVLPFGAVAPEEFLRGLDFWAYYHSDELTESFGMATVEAMASGLVVILPPYMQKNFGDAALYAEPDEVQAVVARYWDDPDLYAAQGRRAREIVEECFSARAFLRRLADHGVPLKA